jgi:adenosylmethionine-8-amino-7-oxononanoate aminotransferase
MGDLVDQRGDVRQCSPCGEGLSRGTHLDDGEVGSRAEIVQGDLHRLGNRRVQASAQRGAQLRSVLESALKDEPWVGDIRGRGLLIGIELVADRANKLPHPRAARITERILAAAKGSADDGLLLYSATAQANGTDGDQLVIGPPFVIGNEEI